MRGRSAVQAASWQRSLPTGESREGFPRRDVTVNSIKIVLGFNQLETYLKDRAYFAAVIGRVAGAFFCTQDSSSRAPSPNRPQTTEPAITLLHGGLDGFNRKFWRATPGGAPCHRPPLRLE